MRTQKQETSVVDYRPIEHARVREEVDDSWRYNGDFNTEGYAHIVENPFLKTNDNPLSTFSIDVDEAAYSNIRRYINEGGLPPATNCVVALGVAATKKFRVEPAL